MTMKFLALTDLQTAVIAKLKNTSAIATAVTGIFDHVPPQQPFPYIVFAEPYETPDRFFGQGGKSVVFALDVFTSDGSATKKGIGSAGNKTGAALLELILAALTDYTSPITVSNHDVRDVDVQSVTSITQPDGTTRVLSALLEAQLEDN